MLGNICTDAMYLSQFDTENMTAAVDTGPQTANNMCICLSHR